MRVLIDRSGYAVPGFREAGECGHPIQSPLHAALPADPAWCEILDRLSNSIRREEFGQEIDLDAVDVERGRIDGSEPLLENPETVVGPVVELDWRIPTLAERDELKRDGLGRPEKVQAALRIVPREFVQAPECVGDSFGGRAWPSCERHGDTRDSRGLTPELG